MKRLHLFEFGDQIWFPSLFRKFETDFLQFLSNNTPMYRPLIPVLGDLLSKNNNTIIDLCSGSGGGLIYLNKEFKKKHDNLKIVMTDLYPNLDLFRYTCKKSANFSFIETPVDARKVPENLRGLRTMFLSFHHFNPEDARNILQNSIDSGSDIAIFEGLERSFASILAMILSPITLFFTTPFIRPFLVSRIIFTYFIPILPFFVLWDGVVSSLRTYSVKEMSKMVSSLKNNDKYEWEIGKINSGPGKLLYLIGKSKTERQS